MCIKLKYRKPLSIITIRTKNLFIESFNVLLEQNQTFEQFDEYIENRLYDCGYDYQKNFSHAEYVVLYNNYKFYIKIIKPYFKPKNYLIVEFIFKKNINHNHNDDIYQIDLINNIITNIIHFNLLYKFTNIDNSKKIINNDDFDEPLFNSNIKFL